MESRHRAGAGSSLWILRVVLPTVLLISTVGCASAPKGAQVSDAEEAYKTGRYAEAERMLQKAAKSAPADAKTRRALAAVLAAQGKNLEAIAQYRAVVNAEPKDDVSWYQMALLERTVGRSELSLAHLETALRVNPGKRALYADEIARAQMALGRYREAAASWDSLLDQKELSRARRKELLVLKAQAYGAARDYKRAKKAVSAAAKLDPADRGLRAQLKAFD